MYRRQFLTAWVVLLFLSASTSGDEPLLKEGVRLALGGARLHGWAAPEVVDWNNDKLNDIVVGHYSGALFVYLNRGVGKKGIAFQTGAIQRRDRYSRGGVPVWAWRFNKANCVCPGPGRLNPRVLDWDGDGKKDIIIGDGSGAQTRIWRNIGTDMAPLFSTHHLQYLPPDGGVRPYHETVQPCIADWNGDGKKDLIMGRNRGVYIYLNEGTNRTPDFAFERSRLGAKIRNVFPEERLSPVCLDWDNDGRQDLLVGSQRGEVWFARNVGSKSRPLLKSYTLVRAAGKAIQVGSEARIAAADLDGDGRKDLVVGSGTGRVWFFAARNPNPVARRRHFRIKPGRSVAINLVGTDDAKRNLTYNLITPPAHGSLSGTAPKLRYTPRKGFVGSDQFTFNVAVGKLKSAPATVAMNVGADKPPLIAEQPTDEIVGVGQPIRFRVVASGTPPFSYVWKRNGKVIPRATRPDYFIRKARQDASATFSVTIKNSAGSVSSRSAALKVKPFPTKADDVPIIGIQYKSPVVEPSTSGLLTLTRTGNLDTSVVVKLVARRGHHPVVADIHYVPVPESITFKAGQAKAQIRVTPINDTLVNGTQTLNFMIVPNPAYRIAARGKAARMIFHDDDCPQVGIIAVKDSTSDPGAQRRFIVTAKPPPRRPTKVAYSVSGTAIGGLDYEQLSGTVTIPAGKTSATIVIQPYRQKQPGRKTRTKKTVVLTLPQHRFTYFDFYGYLTQGRSRTGTVAIAASASSPLPPQTLKTKPADLAVAKLRREVARLGWIVFTARSRAPNSDLDIFLMRPDGSQLRNITNTPQSDEYSARVSPDGKKVLYRRTKKLPKPRSTDITQQDVGTKAIRTWPTAGALVIANADGSSPKAMGGNGSFAWATWGPKGKRIACLEKVVPKERTAKKDAAKKTKRVRKRPPTYRIIIRDAGTMKILRSLPSAGIHSQAIWSPDGKRICGPANILPGRKRWAKGIEYSLGLGKMVSLDIESGKRKAIARFPDWSPVWATDSDGDWFQGGSPGVLHSANNYGICPAYNSMLWRSGLKGKPSQLVFAEYMKNIWGGCTSPNDKYAIFVIASEKWPLQGKMAIIRLADAPIARGRSSLFHEVLADHFPKLKKQGPILDLLHVREGFDPHWTMAAID